jgi:hypothetical protein
MAVDKWQIRTGRTSFVVKGMDQSFCLHNVAPQPGQQLSGRYSRRRNHYQWDRQVLAELSRSAGVRGLGVTAQVTLHAAQQASFPDGRQYQPRVFATR